MSAIEIQGLSKSYRIGLFARRERAVLRDLTLEVNEGEIFGFLGPNGAGKTTTLKILMGLIKADRGSVRILDCPLSDRAWRKRTGYLPEQPYLYDYLTPVEYLRYVGQLFGMSPVSRQTRADELLSVVGLGPWRKTPLRRFSKGMLQRAGLAQALMNDPALVVLDEPMSGLDPIGRHLVRKIILDLKRAGKTVFFSTHILSDAESLCDRVALLSGGALVKAGSIAEILNLDVSHIDVLLAGFPQSAISRLPAGVVAHATGERFRLEVPEQALHAVLRLADEERARILVVQPVRQSLEEYFVDQIRAAEGTEPTWTAD
jgi:ABC-2 type transport system ATP-binding protein